MGHVHDDIGAVVLSGVLLVLLLTLAMSLGMLSTGLNATLDVSERERAQYAVGGDLRFSAKASPEL